MSERYIAQLERDKDRLLDDNSTLRDQIIAYEHETETVKEVKKELAEAKAEIAKLRECSADLTEDVCNEYSKNETLNIQIFTMKEENQRLRTALENIQNGQSALASLATDYEVKK